MSYRRKIEEILQNSPSFVPCGYGGCPDHAITREHDDQPLCMRHWQMRQDARIREDLKKIGLDSVPPDQKRELCREQARKWLSHVASEPNKSWAHSILQRFEDGENIPQRAVELARTAIG